MFILAWGLMPSYSRSRWAIFNTLPFTLRDESTLRKPSAEKFSQFMFRADVCPQERECSSGAGTQQETTWNDGRCLFLYIALPGTNSDFSLPYHNQNNRTYCLINNINYSSNAMIKHPNILFPPKTNHDNVQKLQDKTLMKDTCFTKNLTNSYTKTPAIHDFITNTNLTNLSRDFP